MCIAVWLWQVHPHYPLLLLHNRDELHSRPTKPMSWWGDSGKVLGGRDCVAGGTWLACTRNGRLAFLTNVLEPDEDPCAKSRGELPLRFLESGKSPREYAEEVVKEAHKYNGFNLIIADLPTKTMIYVSNRPQGETVSVQEVSPGLHVLSNARLDSPWHKALRLGKNFKELICRYPDKEVPMKEMVQQLMKDTVKADKAKLPNTGCDSEWELSLSSIFVEVDSPLVNSLCISFSFGTDFLTYEKVERQNVQLFDKAALQANTILQEVNDQIGAWPTPFMKIAGSPHCNYHLFNLDLVPTLLISSITI